MVNRRRPTRLAPSVFQLASIWLRLMKASLSSLVSSDSAATMAPIKRELDSISCCTVLDKITFGYENRLPVKESSRLPFGRPAARAFRSGAGRDSAPVVRPGGRRDGRFFGFRFRSRNGRRLLFGRQGRLDLPRPFRPQGFFLRLIKDDNRSESARVKHHPRIVAVDFGHG